MTEREKISVTIAALYALNKRSIVVSLLKRKEPAPMHLSELFLHLSLLLGFPMMLDGFEKLSAANLLLRSSVRKKQKGYQQRGLRALRRIYGKQTPKLLESLARMHPDLPTMIVEDVYGKVISRAGLSLRERELVNITVLTVQGLTRQLHSHVRGALRIGVPTLEVRKLLHFLSRRFRVNTREAQKLLQQLSS